MSFPEMGAGLGVLRETRQSFVYIDRGQQPLLQPPAARGHTDTIVSMQPIAAPVAQQPRGPLAGAAETELLRQLQEIEQKKESCGSYFCVIPAALFALLGALVGCVLDICCEGLSEGLQSTKSCAKKGFSCWYPSKEDLKRQHVQQARATYVILKTQEDALIRQSANLPA